MAGKRIFLDMTRLITPDGMAMDAHTGVEQVVEFAALLAAGTVCCQYSMLCAPKKRTGSILNIAGSGADQANAADAADLQADVGHVAHHVGDLSSKSSRSTLEALFDYIAKHRPVILLLENVKSMNQAGTNEVTVLDEVLLRLQGFGYVTCKVLMQAFESGIPEDRERNYFGGVLLTPEMTKARLGQRREQFQRDVAAAVKATAMQRPCHSLQSYLLPDDAPRCLAEHLRALRSETDRTDAWALSLAMVTSILA
jgi:site-specific DNA-cytosine methylase